jgi:RNA polymerase sigma-70 factor, ECF subfamily
VIHDFAQLVAEHQAMVYSCAWHCLRDASLAEEVAQEVFLELHRNLGKMDSGAHVRHWLRKAAAHRAIDEARKRRLRPRLSLVEVEEPPAPAAQGDPMMSGTLRRLVASLPATARMVMILRYQEDLDPADIAGVLEMPVQTVKSHLQRSLALLRGKLARCAGGIRK